ncbi:MAG: hypothetical protein H6670_14345 [Anaerolineaceae bacterium]|nr:hypothetical protein [Anaerolineaceae bacterium]
MPFQVSWYIENEIIYMSSSGEVAANDVREAILSTKRLMDSSSKPLVHVIVDVGHIVQPMSVKDMIGVLREMGPHERAGWHIMLQEQTRLVTMGTAIATSLFKFRTRSLDTIEEAEAFLKEIDPTLSWEKLISPS